MCPRCLGPPKSLNTNSQFVIHIVRRRPAWFCKAVRQQDLISNTSLMLFAEIHLSMAAATRTCSRICFYNSFFLWVRREMTGLLRDQSDMRLLYGPTHTLILAKYDFSSSSSLKKHWFTPSNTGNGGIMCVCFAGSLLWA